MGRIIQRKFKDDQKIYGSENLIVEIMNYSGCIDSLEFIEQNFYIGNIYIRRSLKVALTYRKYDENVLNYAFDYNTVAVSKLKKDRYNILEAYKLLKEIYGDDVDNIILRMKYLNFYKEHRKSQYIIMSKEINGELITIKFNAVTGDITATSFNSNIDPLETKFYAQAKKFGKYYIQEKLGRVDMFIDETLFVTHFYKLFKVLERVPKNAMHWEIQNFLNATETKNLFMYPNPGYTDSASLHDGKVHMTTFTNRLIGVQLHLNDDEKEYIYPRLNSAICSIKTNLGGVLKRNISTMTSKMKSLMGQNFESLFIDISKDNNMVTIKSKVQLIIDYIQGDYTSLVAITKSDLNKNEMVFLYHFMIFLEGIKNLYFRK